MIADELEEELYIIERICYAISECEENSDYDAIYNTLKKHQQDCR